jgi:hypothetical protein
MTVPATPDNENTLFDGLVDSVTCRYFRRNEQDEKMPSPAMVSAPQEPPHSGQFGNSPWTGLLGSFSPTTAQQRTKSRIRQDEGPYGYQLAAMLCFLIFADNLLRRIDGHEEMMWFGVSAGKWELILVSGVPVWCATFVLV